MKMARAGSANLRTLPGEVHVWYARPDDASWLAPSRAWLAAAELEQSAQFTFEKDRDAYLAARGFVRGVLSRYLDCAPQAITFETNARGRPLIAHPTGGSPCWFSLSHTSGLLVCAVADIETIGVDAESAARKNPGLAFAERHFTQRESLDLATCVGEQRTHRFLQYWTLKEAYLKARGLGFTGAPDAVEFSFDVAGVIHSRILDTTDTLPQQWRFELLPLASSHVVALALNHVDAQNYAAHVFEWK